MINNLSFSRTLIKNYASSLYDLACVENIQILVLKDLQSVVDYLNNQPSVQKFLISPVIDFSLKSQIINLIQSELKFPVLLNKFLNILVQNKRINYLQKIAFAYEELIQLQQQVKSVTLISANKLTEIELEEYNQSLSAQFEQKINLKNIIDPLIIGGVIIKYDTIVEDYSIKNALDNIKHISK